jgi:hypothetical protein
MSSGSPKLARREQAIEAVRRHLRRVEIETHRIKAHLARLEADYEDDVADQLSSRLRRRVRAASGRQTRDAEPDRAVAAPAVLRFAAASPAEHSRQRRRRTCAPAPADAGQAALPLVADTASEPSRRNGSRYRKTVSPLMLSLAVHTAALLLCITFTFATLVQPGPSLLASPTALDDETADELSEVEIEPTRFEDAHLQNVVYEQPEFNVADSLLRELEPTEIGAGAQPVGDVGQLDALPNDLGALMAGAGEPGGGKLGGPLGSALFFGARATGDRFVFVVDNSSSMKNGRLEMAIAELVQTVEALSARQSFYVIFVSDKTYPMFYPEPAPTLLPATPAIKKRLTAWLPKAILASGNNRELIKAMDMAATLRPDAVFLLWDGDLKYSEKVRQEVMTHLTRPKQWDFAVHTLGMGVTSLDAEYNLIAIANAHGGTFQRINVPAARGR